VNNALEGKFLTIFRRQDDGTWRIYRDAFNFNSE
jgi:ketosteroid isomerase-like protein